MLVSDRPSVLRLDDSFESVHALSVNDFWRPTYSPTAVVEGHYSVACYLSGLRSTWRTMASATSRTRDDFGYMLFHLPFPRIAWKAHVALAEIASGIDPGSRDDLEAERPVFEAKVEPALWASSEIGNIYTGSLWLSLAALLESEPAVSAGKLISLYSYGSGSCSELLTGRVGDDPTAWHGRIGLATALSSRIEIDHDLYIAFRSAELELRKNGSYVPGRVPLEEHVPSGTHSLFLGVRDHMRVYRPGAGWRPSVEPRVQIREDEPPEAWCDMWMLGQEPPWKVR
jgi:hydroxymethylglutaryl-CoA synthase